MKITKISGDYTPIRQGILFGISTESEVPTDLVVEIVNSTNEKVVATQFLHSVTEAQVNIAPYIEPTSSHIPSQCKCISIADTPLISHHIRIGDVVSEPVLTWLNTEAIVLPSLISSMPQTRRISREECDEIALMVGGGKNISVAISSDLDEYVDIQHYTTTGCAILSISPMDFDEKCRCIDVVIRCNDQQIGNLHYNIVPALNGSVRVAWISEYGSIERYSFPAAISSKHLSKRQIIRTTEGWHAANGSTEYSMSLCSHYEPRATIEALAQIVSSPKVWIENEKGCDEVAVTSSVVEQSIFNGPNCICLDMVVWHRKEAVC